MEGEDSTFAFSNGLIELQAPVMGTIVTGTRYGLLEVTVETHDEAVEPALTRWEEVIEISFYTRSGDVQVREWTGSPADGLSTSFPESTWLRMRVHVRGRDTASDRGMVENAAPPVETHLIQMWPAAEAPEQILREDRFGKSLRERLR